MHGVTTALVGFLLVCVIFPNLVKQKALYYASFAAVCLIIIFDALGLMVSGPETALTKFRVFTYVMGALLQVAAILMLFLSCGGITWRQLADDMKDAVEVIRRGGEEKEIIVPLSGDLARIKAERRAERDEPAEPQRYVINDPTPAASAPPAPNDKLSDKPGIPLEP
jgi:hypothetical protein